MSRPERSLEQQVRGGTPQGRRSRALAAALALSLFLGCVSGEPEVSTAFDPLVRFPAQATFLWDESAIREPDDPRIRELNFGPRLRKLTTEALIARGYREAESEAADYYVSYHLSVHSWISAEHSSSVGSLSILLIDAPSEQRVWMGFARAEAQVGLSEEIRNERLRAIVQRMFARFPPNQIEG
jgi:hypothetical protein